MSRRFKEAILVVSLCALLCGCGAFGGKELSYYEKNHLFCLTGIAVENPGILRLHDFGIVNVFIAWKDGFPEDYIANLGDNSLLMITWEPYLKDFAEPSILPDIVDGKYDGLIAEMARSVKAYGKLCLLRWAHEMNGNWYPWGASAGGNSPDVYIAAWKRIKNIFETTGCKNVRFVFSVNNYDVPAARANRFERYYPGTKYVDILGIDAYNWGSSKKGIGGLRRRSRWRRPSQIIEKTYKRMLRLDPGKPIILTETASSSEGGDKAEWIREFFMVLPARFPAIKGFIWFDYDKETDWFITADRDLFSLYQRLEKKGYFINRADKQELFR